MKLSLSSSIIVAAIAGALALASPAFAKTAKECRAEWTANKAANQAKGITEKVYVEQCRAGESAAKPKAEPAAAKAKEKAEKTKATKEKTSTAMEKKPAAGEKKTAKECEAEWRANKAANQAKGVTEKAYVAECRGGAKAMNPAPAPVQTKMTPPANAPMEKKTSSPMAAPAKPAAQAKSPGMGKPEGANQFAAESAAKAHCPGGLVVWANLDSKIYHFPGHSDYGKTKQGAYMCEKDAMSEGLRAAKNEKHP